MSDSKMVGGFVGSILSLLLVKLDAFATREWKLQENIRKAVETLERELWSIEELLRDACSKKEHDHQFRVWIQNVRDQAYDFEDVLDMFRLDMAKESVWHRLKMHRAIINNLIQTINNRLEKLEQTKQRYRSIVTASTSRDNHPHPYLSLRLAPFYNTSDTVGIEEPTEKLVSWALEPKNKLQVMFVVGMAGLGKTTLVHEVYQMVHNNFDLHAWITASTSKPEREILLLLVERFGCSISHGADVVDLIRSLQEVLRDKRYVIVIDDLWIKDEWESIRLALPGDGNDSRIMITTRRGDIANSCKDDDDDDSINIHKLQPLSPEKAVQLFYQKAFSRNGRCSSSGLEQVTKSILQECDGLPLGIVEIGRLLSIRPPTTSLLQRLLDSLEFELSSGDLSYVTRVLSASYMDLPYHLKHCFLYMSIFPENNPVQRKTLVRLWIAEGFVTEETGQAVEEVGEKYLKELIDRNLIKANELDFDGLPKSVGVHSLMLKIILTLSREENFCTVCTGAARKLTDKTRRISIQKEDFDVSSLDLTCVRSFFSFGIGKVKIGSNFKLLKVLDIQGTPLEEFPSVITDLLLLRYLSLRNTNIKNIPSSLGNLRKLETLDLKQTLVKKVPKAVLQLERLRNLLVYRYDLGSSHVGQGFKAPKKMGTALKSLQRLSLVKAKGEHRLMKELQSLTQLRKLGIVELEEEDGLSLCYSIEQMQSLHSLDVASLNQEFLKLDAMVNPPRGLQRLYLKGPLQRFPNWISSLHDLVRVGLKWSSLAQDDPVAALQDLPNLMELQLLDAYTGFQLDFKPGKFQKLKILDIEGMQDLRLIIMEQGTLPCLQKLIIGLCSNLVGVPRGIDKLTHLQMLVLRDMPETFVTRLKKNGGEFDHLIRHITCIHSYKQGQMEDLS